MESVLNIYINNIVTNDDICEYIYSKSKEVDYILSNKTLKLILNYKNVIVEILMNESKFCYLDNELKESTMLKAISYYIDKDDVYNLDVILSHYNNEFYKETIYCCAQKMKPMRTAKFYKLLNGYKDSRNLYENIKKEKGILGKFL